MLRLHDTARGEVLDIIPREVGKFTLYVCGPTVYGAPHVGHGRFALVYDVLRRYLTFAGNEVTHVSNITDIDDKIINRANSEGRSWQEVASECEAQWWSAMDAMNILRPTMTPHATDYVEQMTALIADLVAKDHAYETTDGVYLSVTDVADYGLLKHQDLDSLLAGARVDVIEEKRHPGDFALWKKVKPGEPSWPSSFGDGRPGWHTECVVMSLELLGEGFDLHGGGQDLIFPHHENERAQAVADGKDFSKYWIHNGFVTVSGEKMSKSLNNFTNLEDLIATTDPRAYRLLVLQSHYRSPLEVTTETLSDAAAALMRLDSFARRLAIVAAPSSGFDYDDLASAALENATENLEQFFIGAMDDDLDTPKALGRLFTDIRRANAALDKGDIAGAIALGKKVVALFSVLGVDVDSGDDVVDDSAQLLVDQRDAARVDKDWVKADELRAALEALGYVVTDTPGGTQIHR